MRRHPLKEIEKNLRAIISKVRNYNPSIKIYLWEMRTFQNMGTSYSLRYLKIFSSIAKKEKIHLIPFPLKNVVTKRELNQPDGIHPNSKGANILAENIWKILEKDL